MKRDVWVPACGGSEQPFLYEGQEFLYMWNASTGEHAYYWSGRDVFVRDFRTREPV